MRDAGGGLRLLLIALRAKNLFSVTTSARCYPFSPPRKNKSFRGDPKSPVQLSSSRPASGALAIVTNVGAGCGGRGGVGRVVVIVGRALVRERTQRADDRRGCVRQNRVVLAPVAGAKSRE